MNKSLEIKNIISSDEAEMMEIDEIKYYKKKFGDDNLLKIEECQVCQVKFGKYFGSYQKNLETGKKYQYNPYGLCGKKECWEDYNQWCNKENEKKRIGKCDECNKRDCPQIFKVPHHWRKSIGGALKAIIKSVNSA